MEERGEYDARYFTLPCINSTNVDQIQEYQSNACVEEEFGTGCVKSAPSRKKIKQVNYSVFTQLVTLNMTNYGGLLTML